MGELENLRTRIRWLITLRWIAAGCLAVAITATHYLLRIRLFLLPLYGGNLALLGLNTLYSLLPGRRTGLFINVQIALDLILLAFLLHFSGGIENPFILFFVFHMVIASILLSNRAAYLQAAFAVALFGLLLIGEKSGWIPHYHLDGFLPSELAFSSPAYLLILLLAFAATIFITVYMTTSIVNKLREHEQALERKDREKSLYVQTVSHDIKGSLSAIQSCLKVVLDGLTGPVSEKSTQMVIRAERRSLSLLRFVNELLYLSSLRADNVLERQRISLSEIIARQVEAFGPVLQQKGIRLSIEDAPRGAAIYADREAIGQLVFQLFDNAIKRTQCGGQISVSVQKGGAGGGVQVSVLDTGERIPETDVPHIFEDFYYSAGNKETEGPGIGLGLAIAKHIVHMHGGKIWAESRPGEGSAFAFSLPA